MKTYKWDIAISLCKQDIEFARKLFKAFNQSLRVFFYEYKQEELISKCGPEEFARIFKEESRIVVILSREEWGDSVYTGIERNAIVDRSSIKNDGYDFLVVIPMQKGEVPVWYPTNKIYIDPANYTVDLIAKFIEFKVTQEGGIVKPLTLEDRYQSLIDSIESKKSVIRLQNQPEAIEQGRQNLKNLRNCFNEKATFLQQSLFDGIQFNPFFEYGRHASFSIGNHILSCNIKVTDEMYNRINSTQDFCVSFQLYKIYGNSTGSNKLLIEEERLYYYNPPLHGWSVRYLAEQATEKETQVLFGNRRNEFYDLISPLSTHAFVDTWFQKLLEKSSELIKRYI